MATFPEANQVRLALKMKLSLYSWYKSSVVTAETDGYSVIVGVKTLNNTVRKIIPQVMDDVSIKTEVE
jgi:hypothetical protein